jgi:short-subunit dehydrogenase
MTNALPSGRGRVLITGTTSGIGRRTAIYLAQRGWQVFATGMEQELLPEVAREGGANLHTLYLDVTKPASIEAARAEVERLTDGQGLDVLINNAGYGTAGPTELISDGDLRAQYEVNVFGLMSMVRAFVPAMRQRGRGRVINVSSLGGLFTIPFLGVYTSTKYAVESLSDALRMELRPFGIDVVLVEPAMIRTGFADRSMHEASKYAKDLSSPYAPLLARRAELRGVMEKTAYGAEHVVQAIERALVARRPRARYAAPRRAGWAIAWFRLLPVGLRDFVLGRFAGLDALHRRR